MQLEFFPIVGMFNINIDPQSDIVFIGLCLLAGIGIAFLFYSLAKKGPYNRRVTTAYSITKSAYI
jgi:hypothetical protein